MFTYPGTEVYDAQGARRVVWSEEEYGQALADGWLTERPVEPTTAMIQEPKKRGKAGL